MNMEKKYLILSNEASWAIEIHMVKDPKSQKVITNPHVLFRDLKSAFNKFTAQIRHERNISKSFYTVHHKLPLKIFLLNNGVYLSIKAMQDSNYKGFYVGSDSKSGVSFPDFIKVAKAFGFKTEQIKNQKEMCAKIKKVLSTPDPVFCEILLDPNEVLQPRLKSKLFPGGKMSQSPLEDMWPFLDREEFMANMIVPPLDEPNSEKKPANTKTEFE